MHLISGRLNKVVWFHFFLIIIGRNVFYNKVMLVMSCRAFLKYDTLTKNHHLIIITMTWAAQVTEKGQIIMLIFKLKLCFCRKTNDSAVFSSCLINFFLRWALAGSSRAAHWKSNLSYFLQSPIHVRRCRELLRSTRLNSPIMCRVGRRD